MTKENKYYKVLCWVLVCAFIFTGCSGNDSVGDKPSIEGEKDVMEEKIEESETEPSDISQEEDTKNFTESILMEPKIVDEDWSEYFDALNGAAVVYDVPNNQYGNCDISDWKGKLNTNNNNRALTGFWIESSLMISPKEQVEIMERIFGENSDYSKKTLKELKKVMLVSKQEKTNISIYGKTGMGKADGIVVDAWFTGFAEGKEGNMYFCVHLGRTDDMNVSSSLAKEIAIQIVLDYYNQ